MSAPSVQTAAGTRTLTFAQAVNEALTEELRLDERVFLIGEDIAEAGTPFKVLSGLVEEFGPERILDSPISEAGITGLGVGAAMTGLRPVVDIMFGDFLTLVMDQLANQAAKAHYMSGGKLKVPLTLRTTMGATRRSAAQHSQSLQAWVAPVPGLKVALPATPRDAKGLMKSAIVVDEGHNRYGVTAEIASVIADRAFWSLDAPVKRLGALDVPIPFSPPLEDVTVPTPDLVVQTARELCRK